MNLFLRFLFDFGVNGFMDSNRCVITDRLFNLCELIDYSPLSQPPLQPLIVASHCSPLLQPLIKTPLYCSPIVASSIIQPQALPQTSPIYQPKYKSYMHNPVIVYSQYIDTMGQDHPKNPKPKNSKRLPFNGDPRLMETTVFIPELFQGVYNQEIKKLQRLISHLPDHCLFTPIVDGINDRFQIGRQTSNNSKKTKAPIIQYHELRNIDLFYDLLIKIQKWHNIEKQLCNNLHLNRSQPRKTRKFTIRKKIHPLYTTSLNSKLYAKIFIYYYVIIVKSNLGSTDEKRKRLIQNFHDRIGKIILKMIEYQQLSEEKIKELAYKVVCIEKMHDFERLQRTLEQIMNEFWPISLAKEHSIEIDERQYEKYRQISKCYLSQLYLRSIKEAEDPDIIDENDSLGYIKIFPVKRVKDNLDQKQ